MTPSRTVEVDVAGLTKEEAVHERLAVAFGFPSYYGKNWDAFWDCVSTLNPMPQKIRIRGLESLANSLPREAALLKKCLADLQTIPETAGVVLELT